MKYVLSFGIMLKRLAIFAGSIAFVYLIYRKFLPDVWQRDNVLVSLTILWLVTAYFVLPRIHRFLSGIYVPDNFIGRTRTADGLLGDPVNMAIRGSREDLIDAMVAAGWVKAEKLTIKSSWKMAKAVVLSRSYPAAPVTDAFLFGKRQSFAFQMEVDNNPSKRHHVRYWRAPHNWYLPGGKRVDWLGAASYDESVSMSLFTMQFTHAIGANVDKERDFIIASLDKIKKLKKVDKIEHFFSAYRTRNGFGHHYITDGSMVIAELKQVNPS